MAAFDLEVNRGVTFSTNISLVDNASAAIDLTSYNVSGHIKYRYSDTGIIADLNVAKVAPYTGGIVSLSIAPSGTAVLPITLAVYDINILHTGSGILTKAAYGNVKINPNVG